MRDRDDEYWLYNVITDKEAHTVVQMGPKYNCKWNEAYNRRRAEFIEEEAKEPQRRWDQWKNVDSQTIDVLYDS